MRSKRRTLNDEITADCRLFGILFSFIVHHSSFIV